ncbi:hypothetical protein BJ875DRAFT_490300 [Amylocarpus encephaloides]|uniref:Uncharacterized protein n=1 Tax=Amylocarpus encephaloides TaxID=45428 RepID=A0A9P7Y632_9HELO|nr:hypothetical protein BJ875DRAFT_490300 [Amylocarpus encephaloides]
MAIKRKRSDSEISSGSSLISSPLRAADFMAIDCSQSQQTHITTPSLFSARTRKRHRDNRPSEFDVHQHTLSLLYSTQQAPRSSYQTSPSPFALPNPVASLPTSNPSTPSQASLHSFWTLPASRHISPVSISSTSSIGTPLTSSANQAFFQATNCEDCDALLNIEDNTDAVDVDMMMDIDTNGDAPNYGCTSCGKQVCHSCAISNLGAERKCLNCAGKARKWVGGLGWMIE